MEHVSLVAGEEASQLAMLEGQWRAALDKSKHRKKQARQLEGDLQVCVCEREREREREREHVLYSLNKGTCAAI